MNQLYIVILAAGQGKRMFSNLPKVLHPLGGIPLLERVVNTARTLNPQKIIVIYGHAGEQVRTSVHGDDICWVNQTEQLGTGHALKIALPYLAKVGKTLVLYGDVPLVEQTTLKELIEISAEGVALLSDILPNPYGYGRIVRNQNEISAIIEEKDCSDTQRQINEVNTGIFVLPNTHLATWLNSLENSNAQGEYYLTDVIALAVQDKLSINTLQVKQHWQAAGVNNKSQLAQLERVLQRNQAEELLNAGVMLADPMRIDIRGVVQHGRDVFIDVNVILEGNINLGDNVQIGANCILKNVCLASGTQIAPFSHIDGASVAKNCRIGPFARIRPGTRLENSVHIGNFVEIKNSDIKNDSKINHLSYIGDTSIGKCCNIGAGTITCNYDGANKYRTIIGDKVFVGSGCMLVAPIELQDESTIGAGSVITHDTPANSLSLTRSKQVSITNWQRPNKKSPSEDQQK